MFVQVVFQQEEVEQQPVARASGTEVGQVFDQDIFQVAQFFLDVAVVFSNWPIE